MILAHQIKSKQEGKVLKSSHAPNKMVVRRTEIGIFLLYYETLDISTVDTKLLLSTNIFLHIFCEELRDEGWELMKFLFSYDRYYIEI